MPSSVQPKMQGVSKQVEGTDRCVNADLEVLEIKIVKSSIMLIRRNLKKDLDHFNHRSFISFGSC